ncbi:MAG TPA: beta-L-arabinofuranosidase domain-containing protein [Mycobacteriales bacterium]|nr:beta-L-arabinofuranosidase domain-containing protein [Mycobacteriales bacterium]
MDTDNPAGPVQPRAAGLAARPVAATLTTGFLADRQRANAETSIRAGHAHLEAERAWANFENAAAGRSSAHYHGPVFEDGEAYKWLEAVAWEAARSGDADLLDWLRQYTELIGRAQANDGYINTFFQVAGQRESRYERLDVDHEIFNMGAMTQAAVAQFRATGRTEFLDIACRAADHLDRTFGPGKIEGACGHPVIEMALVELFRATGEKRYLDLARYFVDVRGRGLIQPTQGEFRSVYFSDRIPVRETTVPEGHAVRAVYLAAGATDVAIETGDSELLAALERQWENMVRSKTYVTGGLGSRWEGEAFGDPYELPPDRAYAETCAAIASMQWNRRLLLATGNSRYADLFERQFYNAVLSGVSLANDAYFYVNALQVRSDPILDEGERRAPAFGRQPWYGCSCCPTNLMRTLASIQHYVVSSTVDGMQIDQYASCTVESGAAALTLQTDYPWDGTVRIRIDRNAESEWALRLRIPAWAEGATVSINAAEPDSVVAGDYHELRRIWASGDEVVLELPMRPRLSHGHPRVDAIRGAVAIERGPLVYAIEQCDQADGVTVDDVAITGGLREESVMWDGVGAVPVVTFEATCTDPNSGSAWDSPAQAGKPATVRAIPYFMWGNRELGPMKVWIPAQL